MEQTVRGAVTACSVTDPPGRVRRRGVRMVTGVMDGVGVGVALRVGVGVGVGLGVSVGVGAAANGVGWSEGGVPGGVAACDGWARAATLGTLGDAPRPASRTTPPISTIPARATAPIASTLRDGIGRRRAALANLTHGGASPRA